VGGGGGEGWVVFGFSEEDNTDQELALILNLASQLHIFLYLSLTDLELKFYLAEYIEQVFRRSGKKKPWLINV